MTVRKRECISSLVLWSNQVRSGQVRSEQVRADHTSRSEQDAWRLQNCRTTAAAGGRLFAHFNWTDSERQKTLVVSSGARGGGR